MFLKELRSPTSYGIITPSGKEWITPGNQKGGDRSKRYLDLLLLADEQENMVDRYLEWGSIYVLEEDGVRAECVVMNEGNGTLGLRNIAGEPASQGRSYGKITVDFFVRNYTGRYAVLQVGIGDGSYAIPFYESCGFRRCHLVKNFFTDRYEHPVCGH